MNAKRYSSGRGADNAFSNDRGEIKEENPTKLGQKNTEANLSGGEVRESTSQTAGLKQSIGQEKKKIKESKRR